MSYRGSNFYGNANIQGKVWNGIQTQSPHPQNNFYTRPRANSPLIPNSFNNYGQLPNIQYPIQNRVFRQYQPIVRKVIPVTGNYSNISKKPQPLLKNVMFNNSASSTTNNHNRKRPHSSSTDTDQQEIDVKRQKSSNVDHNDTNTGDKYSRLTQQAELYTINHSQTDEMLDKKLKLRSALLCMIKKQFPGVSLHLVGSSCNGFASDSSDADFCIMISQVRKVNQKHEARFYLKSVESLIRPIRSLKGMQFIRAKVPILKFKDSISGCDCDINVNNDVGIRNTHLLRTYSKIDKRVQPMVMAIKRWGKARKINDASQGTLSSYSLVLMILHYLQSGCNPPVLPALQQRYPQYFKVDSNVDELPMFEPANMIPCDNSSNKESVGQLLVGFFKYFAEKFIWDSKIMSVRSGCTLPKKNNFEFKDKYISIEEPFELSNTARAVHELSRFVLIKKEFRRANEHLNERLSLEYIM